MTREEVDVLVVGAGFSGIHQLHTLRKLGYKVKAVEAASGMGGVWYSSRWPGARVDSEVPLYEFSWAELWKEFNFEERYPTRDEILKYFEFVDKKLDLKKDIYFNTRVLSAEFDTLSNKWIVRTDNPHGLEFNAQFLDLCLGFASKPYFPPFEGIQLFKGLCFHSSNFPLEGLDFHGKEVAVIGTGASGVQIIQGIGPSVSHLTVFQRTPNYSLPMTTYPLSDEHYSKKSEMYPLLFKQRLETYGGVNYAPVNRSTFDDSPEIRKAFYEKLWAAGNFQFWVGNYVDTLAEEKANLEAYKFWCEKTRSRVRDPAMQDILAPLSPPHPFGTKRPSLEINYYEVFNQPNVSLIDINSNPITSFTPSGIRTKDGIEHEVDIIVMATGFDLVSGGINQIKIKGSKEEITLEEKWKSGIRTFMGVSSSGFPNLFFIYGPHGPSALSNSPACLEYQGDWVAKCIDYVKKSGKSRIEAEESAESDWSKHVNELYSLTLFSKTESPYGGANIPGKKREALCYSGGINTYVKLCNANAEKGYEGFVIE